MQQPESEKLIMWHLYTLNGRALKQLVKETGYRSNRDVNGQIAKLQKTLMSKNS